ncbi:hypothetical protein BDV27DRAFT_134163, partial [Aspergillus caelatus]
MPNCISLSLLLSVYLFLFLFFCVFILSSASLFSWGILYQVVSLCRELALV